MIDQQERRLLGRIERHPGILPEELAAHYDVSERTIRTYVRRLNDAIEGAAHINKLRGKGYELVVTDRAALAAMLDQGDIKSVPSSPDDRVAYLLSDLLQRTDWITTDDFANILFVSCNAIRGDLKRVEEELERFGLSLERRPHYGIRVQGPEMSRRLCLASITIDRLNDSSDAQDENHAMLRKVASCVDEALAEDEFQINSSAYQNLLVHIAIAALRIRKGCYVPMEDEYLSSISSKREYLVAEHVAARIASEFEIELPQEEVAYIGIHLAGKQSLYVAQGEPEEGLVISDEVWDVVSEMLECVWESYHFDFRGDLELRMNLARHIVPLAVRLKFSMSIANPLLSDIKERFPLAYSMGLDTSAILTEHFGGRLSDDETGYIALAFALALERQKTEMPKKNILVVCASGQGSARLLEYRYREEFGALVDKVVTCDISHIDAVDFKDIDYVFTTVPIGKALPVPVRQVSFFLDDADARGVREVLSENKGNRTLASYFDERLFIPGLKVANKEEALAAVCKRAAEVQDVPSDFYDLVLRREKLAQTSFGNQVAMPHPARPVSEHTFVTVALLDEPVEWNGQPVRAIFLVSVSVAKDKKLDHFYRSMAKLLTSKDAIQQLVGAQTWEILEKLLEDYDTNIDKE
jgi:lichenan operon transcriptional antiterminator